MPRKTLSLKEFAARIQPEASGGVVVAYGQEQLLQDQAAALAREAADADTRDFNLDVFHGDALDAQTLASRLGAMPMMAARRVLLVKRGDALDAKTRNYLLEYVKKPVPSTLLVLLIEGSGRKEPAWLKGILAASTVVDCSPPRAAALARFLSHATEEMGVKLGKDALDLLVDQRDARLIDLVGEVEKASLLVEDGEELQAAHLQLVWGIEKEVNIWQFFDKVASGARLEALRDFESMRETFEKQMGSGFAFTQIMKRWRLVWKERGYDALRTPAPQRKWAGSSQRQWQMAANSVKALPRSVAERALERMLKLDRERKSSSRDSLLGFQELIHRTALDREGGQR